MLNSYHFLLIIILPTFAACVVYAIADYRDLLETRRIRINRRMRRIR